MTPDDLATLHADAMAGVSEPWSADDFEVLLGSYGVFLVTVDGTRGAAPRAPRDISRPKIAGFALGRVVADEAELLTLAVRRSDQGHGSGRACLHAFEDEARTRGAARAFLEVAETNAAAIRLYTRAGYGNDGTRKGYYRLSADRHIDAILMSKSL